MMERTRAENHSSDTSSDFQSSKFTLESELKDGRVKALEEERFYSLEVMCNAEEYPIKKDNVCQCRVKFHPYSWTKEQIDLVHKFSNLLQLDPDGDKITEEFIIAKNKDESLITCDVPMKKGHFLLSKAEAAIRYTDLEAMNGDFLKLDKYGYEQPPNRKIFIMVSNNRVEGLVVAEPVVEAHGLLVEDRGGYQELEEDSVPVRVGINRIWVHVSQRRQRWATALCDIVRRRFHPEEVLQLTDIAFNISVDSVQSFAKSYLGETKVPLYEGKVGKRVINVPLPSTPQNTQE